MGAVMTRRGIFDAIADAAGPGIELFHGYTYSGHPLACAAALATLEVYREEELFERCAGLAPAFEDRLHSLRGTPLVEDVRNLGLIGAVQLESRQGAVGARGAEVFNKCFEAGVLVRVTGDIVALSPPFIAEEDHLDRILSTLETAIRATV